MLRNPVHWLAFGFGAGLLPWAPGASGRVTRLRVDGRPIDGNLVPLPAVPGAEVEVVAFVEATP